MLMMGKRPAKIEPTRRLMLKNYLVKENLPSLLDSVDWSGGIADWGMHLNDRIGCCVVAGSDNAIESVTKCSSGIERTVPDGVTESIYSLLSGYNPVNPNTDVGLVGVDFLNWWRRNGLNGSILQAYADPVRENLDEFKFSVQEFGGVFIGVQLRQGDMDDFLAGRPWFNVENQGDPIGGHWMWVPIHNPQGPVPITWTKDQPASWAWLLARYDEAHTPFLPLWLNKDGKSPASIDWTQLTADLNIVTQKEKP